MPDIPIRLQDHFLACRTCGVAVAVEDDVVIVETPAANTVDAVSEPVKAPQNPLRIIEHRDRPRTVLRFALCPTCRQADELAEQLCRRPCHSEPYARQLVGGAMDALLFLNARLITIGRDRHLQRVELDDLGASSWLAGSAGALGQPGRGRPQHLQPASLRAPEDQPAQRSPGRLRSLVEGAKRSSCSGDQNLTAEVTDDRAGSAPLLVIETGCLICGVSHQVMPAVEVAAHGRLSIARQIWTPKRVNATHLGGSSSLELSGHLCKICADAVEHVHSVGPSSMERALAMALVPDGVSKLDGWNQITMDGLAGWAASVARAHRGNSPNQPVRPNAMPWKHLGDLDAVRKQLRQRLGAGVGRGDDPLEADHDQNREVNAV